MNDKKGVLDSSVTVVAPPPPSLLTLPCCCELQCFTHITTVNPNSTIGAVGPLPIIGLGLVVSMHVAYGLMPEDIIFMNCALSAVLTKKFKFFLQRNFFLKKHFLVCNLEVLFEISNSAW